MRCERCFNEDDTYFYFDGEKYYCRKCVGFGRVDVGELPEKKVYPCKKHRIRPKLEFPLTPYQKKLSDELVENVKNGQDTLVYATTGAGKTELVFEAITWALNHGKKVGFAIARRQVVLEICERLKKAFPKLNVIAVCQGFTDIDDGDLIVCTMHQLYRYYQTFDLLIMDEVDAFPYKNNEVLEAIAMHSCIGVKIYLTATPSEKMLQEVHEGKLKMLELFVRPHGKPLIVPQVICCPFIFQLLHCLWLLMHTQKQVLVFVPTIRLCEQLSYLKMFLNCESLTSKTVNKEEIMDKFRKKEIQFLFTTTLLERGITIKGVDVFVLKSDHGVFDEASLIQIIGRVGRDFHNPTGTGIFYCEHQSKEIKKCLNTLRRMNEALQNML